MHQTFSTCTWFSTIFCIDIIEIDCFMSCRSLFSYINILNKVTRTFPLEIFEFIVHVNSRRLPERKQLCKLKIQVARPCFQVREGVFQKHVVFLCMSE